MPSEASGATVGRKRGSPRQGSSCGGLSPLGQMPSFQETEEFGEDGGRRNLSSSDPIPIKKVAMEGGSSEMMSVCGSDWEGGGKREWDQGPRSFEESRPRSLEMDMSIGTGGEKDSPISKGRAAQLCGSCDPVCHSSLTPLRVV